MARKQRTYAGNPPAGGRKIGELRDGNGTLEVYAYCWAINPSAKAPWLNTKLAALEPRPKANYWISVACDSGRLAQVRDLYLLEDYVTNPDAKAQLGNIAIAEYRRLAAKVGAKTLIRWLRQNGRTKVPEMEAWIAEHEAQQSQTIDLEAVL